MSQEHDKSSVISFEKSGMRLFFELFIGGSKPSFLFETRTGQGNPVFVLLCIGVQLVPAKKVGSVYQVAVNIELARIELLFPAQMRG